MILKDRSLSLHKLLMKLSHMGSIFIELLDLKVLYSIYSMAYISRQYGMMIRKRYLKNISCRYFSFKSLI